MKINVFNNNIMDENTYLITLGSSSIIIDPSYSYDKLSKEAKDNLKAVLLTHGHYDHFMEIESYKNHNLKFYMHQNAYTKLKDSVKNYSFMIRRNFETTLENEELVFVKEGDVFKVGDIEVKVVELFGHTNCSVGYIINDNLFSGDSIFKMSIGRCDLYSGDIKEMDKTIERVKKMNDMTIYPGHGETTTVSSEIKYNPCFNI